MLRERSRKAKAILAAFALLLGALALAAWWCSSQPTVTVPAVAGPMLTSNSPVAAAATAPARSANTSAREEAAVASARPTIPADAVWVVVRVLDAVTKAPVPGADVWWKDATTDARFDDLPLAERRRYYQRSVSIEELVARDFGWHGRTDERGIVRVHAHLQGTAVFAQHHGRHGERGLGVERVRGGAELWIERDLGVSVRAVDANGRACAGVRIVLNLPRLESPCITDNDGLARFEHLQHELEDDGHGRRVGVPASVHLSLPGYSAQPVPFDVLEPPKEPITFVLPPTGELHVSVVGSRPQSARDDARLRVGDVDWHPCSEPRADGMMRFRFVPLGVDVEVDASIDELELERVVPGPVRAGQVVRVVFEMPAEAVVLTGRVLDPEGYAVAVRELTLESIDRWSSGRSIAKTDEQGSFELVVGQLPDREDLRTRGFVVSQRRGPCDILHGRIPPFALQRGRNDLGVIRLAPLPLVVGGRFEFDRVATHRSIPFTIQRWIASDNAKRVGAWQDERDLVEDQDAGGRFIVRGSPWPGRLRISCGRYAEPIEFECGKDGLIVPVVLGCSLGVVCRVPDGADAFRLLRISLTREGDEAPAAETHDIWHDFEALAPGTYTVEVRLQDRPDVLAAERGIVLPTPEGDFDRTISIDLRERLRWLRVRAAAAGRSELRGDVFAFVDQAWRDGLTVAEMLDGSAATLLVPRRPIDLTLVGPWYRPVFLRGVESDVEVSLEPVELVRIEVRGVPELVDQEVVLTVGEESAQSAGSRDVWVRTRWSGTRLRRDEILPTEGVHMLTSGENEVRASSRERPVTAELRVADRVHPLKAFSPKRIPAGTAPVTITFDPAEIRALLDAAKQTQGK